tara:strand:- start:4970 stop:5293 length:324 start_codon:yes stop_codon:yes gene_type:complete
MKSFHVLVSRRRPGDKPVLNLTAHEQLNNNNNKQQHFRRLTFTSVPPNMNNNYRLLPKPKPFKPKPRKPIRSPNTKSPNSNPKRSPASKRSPAFKRSPVSKKPKLPR